MQIYAKSYKHFCMEMHKKVEICRPNTCAPFRWEKFQAAVRPEELDGNTERWLTLRPNHWHLSGRRDQKSTRLTVKASKARRSNSAMDPNRPIGNDRLWRRKADIWQNGHVGYVQYRAHAP